MEIDINHIKSYSELKELLKILEKQGFGWLHETDLHKHKVNDIIYKSNKLNVTYKPDDLHRMVSKLDSYADIRQQIESYFSKFSLDDKIIEYIKDFYLINDESVRTPYLRPDRKDILEWFKFKTKFNLKDEFGSGNYVNFYNLDKNYLKVHWGEYKFYNFREFYRLIFGEECPDISKVTGEWQNLGKIELKLFQKSSANIRGDLTKMKEYYYKSVSDDPASHTVVKYKNKLEVFKSRHRL